MWLINYQLKYLPQLGTASRDLAQRSNLTPGRAKNTLMNCMWYRSRFEQNWFSSHLSSGGGGGGTPGNSWWGCAARLSKTWPYFWPKNVIFPSRFQNRPEIMLSLFTLERKQNNSSNPFRTRISLFLSYSFEIETRNTFIHSRSSLKNHTLFQAKVDKVYTGFQTKTAQKSYPMGMWRHIPI